MNAQITRLFCLLMASALLTTPALAEFDSGSDETDGALDCAAVFSLIPECGEMCDQVCTVVIDLSQALTGDWDTPIPPESEGLGIYDPQQWAVVFKYSTIDIPVGVTVTFKNHPSRAPVVWLATGGVTISGELNLDGEAGSTSGPIPSFAKPGPGGFEGGSRGDVIQGTSAGHGPGSSSAPCNVISFNRLNCGKASYKQAADNCGNPPGAAYGQNEIFPLIGGSGGSGGDGNAAGGAGGGAILIASNTMITLSATGVIRADGAPGTVNTEGNGFQAGGGSGGAIRLIAQEEVAGSGQLSADRVDQPLCGSTGFGRIRVEAPLISNQIPTVPTWSINNVPQEVFPDLATNAPTLKATLVDGVDVPPDPVAGILMPDVTINTLNDVTVQIEATNIPAGTTVEVRAMPRVGDVIEATSSPLMDAGGGLLTATAMLGQLPPGRTEIQLRANWTP